MATPTLIPMFDPQGQVRMIPADKVQSAKAAGGKVAIKMAAPDKTNRWVPADKYQDAITAGGRPVPIEQQAPPKPEGTPVSRFLSNAGAQIKGAVKGFDPRPTPEETAQGRTSAYDYALRPLERVAQAHIEQGKQAAQEFGQAAPLSLHPTPEQLAHRQKAVAHGLATVLPAVGPWAAGAGEEIGEKVGAGDIAGAGGVLAGNVSLLAAPKVLKSIPKLARGFTEAATGTAPHVTADLVKETQAANKAEVAKAAEKTAEQEAKRKLDLKKHFEKTQAAKAANLEGEVSPARKEALNRGVEQLDVKFKDNLEALRKKVNKEANEKYKVLNEALDPIQADPEAVRGALADAVESIKGSSTEPTILKDISRKLEHGEPLVYEDLQGYYSELGRELQKGTLPGDIYHAYDVLQEKFGDQMQKIAESQNLGPQFADARMTWRNMKQTFYDPKSPITRALKAGERGKAIQALSGADQTGIQALAKYDPELARRANTIRGYQAEAKGIKTGTKGLKTLPKLEPKPSPVEPEVGKVGPEEIRGAKLKSLEERKNMIRRRGTWIATGAAGYQLLSNILRGNLAKIPGNILEGIGALTGVGAIAKVLENPKVVEMLTRPTERDIAEVPPELRGDMAQIAKVAEQKGIHVDPRLYAVAGAQPKKRVAAALTP